MCALPQDHDADLIVFGGCVGSSPRQQEACNGAFGVDVPSVSTAVLLPGAHTLKVADQCWQQVKYANIAPQERAYGQCALVGRKMWVVGGCDPQSETAAPLGDCWTLDVDTWSW